MQSFRNLKVWEKAHAVTLDIYHASRSFPKDELYGLTSQMRRASASIGANIAEGSCRKGDVEFGRFLQIAIGSCDETRMWLDLSKDEGYIPEGEVKEIKERYNRIGAMLSSLWKQRHDVPR